MTVLSKKYLLLIERECMSFSFDGRTHKELNESIEQLLKDYERELLNKPPVSFQRLYKLQNLSNP